MARIGTEKRPAFLRVKTERRAQEIAAICGNNGIHFVIELAPDKPEDVSEMDHALRPPEPVVARSWPPDRRSPSHPRNNAGAAP